MYKSYVLDFKQDQSEFAIYLLLLRQCKGNFFCGNFDVKRLFLKVAWDILLHRNIFKFDNPEIVNKFFKFKM